MNRPVLPLVLVIGMFGCTQLRAVMGSAQTHRATPVPVSASPGYSAAEEERDAREIADRINEALNLRREVTVALHNGTTVNVTGRVTVQRYWLVVTAPDRTEFRFRASLIASVLIK